MMVATTRGEGIGMTEVQVLEGREVPLGGIRAITVRRTLPHRDRSFIGAWCFADHYGPHRVEADGTGGMAVPPHPHTGLQTVSWLFSGEIEHRDSGGVVGLVRPGEMNLMTAGAGIAHSEVSTAATTVLHGVQLWVVLPEADRHVDRGFEHFRPPVTALADGAGEARVFLGSLPGLGSSPITTFSPLVGAQLDLVPGVVLSIDVNADFEHGILLDSGDVEIEGHDLAPGDLGCLDAGPEQIFLTAGPDGARALLLGGLPYEEEIVMWWNFVGRDHDEVARYRDEWEASAVRSSSDVETRFGTVDGWADQPTPRIPAPPIPPVRLRPRSRRGKR